MNRKPIATGILIALLLLTFVVICCPSCSSSSTDDSNVPREGNTSAENKRKRIFYELVSAQDTMGTQAGDKHIMAKYGLTHDHLVKIKAEGIRKNWPMP